MAFREGPVVPVPAKDVVALGAVGAVPAGLGVVQGGAIPYRPDDRLMQFNCVEFVEELLYGHLRKHPLQ